MSYPSKPWSHNQQHEVFPGKLFAYDSDSKVWARVDDMVDDSELNETVNKITVDRDSDISNLSDKVLDSDGISKIIVEDHYTSMMISYGHPDNAHNETTAHELAAGFAENGQGFRMPVSGQVTHITLQAQSSSGTAGDLLILEVYKNGVATGKTLSVDCSVDGDVGGVEAIVEETFVAGDRIGLWISHNVNGFTTTEHASVLMIRTNVVKKA